MLELCKIQNGYYKPDQMDFLNLERVLLLHSFLRILLVLASDLQEKVTRNIEYWAYSFQISFLKNYMKIQCENTCTVYVTQT